MKVYSRTIFSFSTIILIVEKDVLCSLVFTFAPHLYCALNILFVVRKLPFLSLLLFCVFVLKDMTLNVLTKIKCHSNKLNLKICKTKMLHHASLQHLPSFRFITHPVLNHLCFSLYRAHLARCIGVTC